MASVRHHQMADGGSLVDRLGFMVPTRFAVVVLLVLCWLLPTLAAAQGAGRNFSDRSPQPPRTPEQPATPDERQPRARVTSAAIQEARASLDSLLDIDQDTRDSLLLEIQRYSTMVNSMRDSLNLAELGLGLELGPEQKASLQRSIDNFTVLIEEIGSELGRMDLEIVGNRISLLDDQGEGIVINIPENLDEHLSDGLNVLSRIILAELPDSLEVQGEVVNIDFNPFKRKEKEKRKIHAGNLFRVGDPLQVASNQDVRGHVVSIFGNAEVSGRVEGNVVVVFGDLQLGEDAQVTGKVVTVGGRLAQDEDAEVADVVVIDPWSRLGVDGPDGLWQPGLTNFLVGQGEFLAMALLAALAVAFAPSKRLESSLEVLRTRPLPSLVSGLLGSLVLHLVALLAMVILVATIIGIPVALLLAVALVMLGILAVALVGLVLGRRICQGLAGRCGPVWVQTLVGLLALHLVAFLGQVAGLVPSLATVSTLLVLLGLGLKTGAYLLGLGALVLGRFGSHR